MAGKLCSFTISLCAIAVLSAWPTTNARAQTAEDFYRGKRELNLITSSSVGGGYDQYSRLVARYMTKYLPGNPTIIVQNMVGGGGIRAANYIYNVAPKDGTVYCLIDRGMPTAPLLYGEKSKAQFEAVKFSWIGSLMRETGMGVLGGALRGQDHRGRQAPRSLLRLDRARDRSGNVRAARQRSGREPRSRRSTATRGSRRNSSRSRRASSTACS